MSELNEAAPPSPPPAAPSPPVSDGPSAEERQWAMFAHLSALLGGLVTGAMGGWGWFIGPLVIWLVKKDTMPFVDEQGKEALNFNITVAAIFIVLGIFSVVTLGIGLLLTIPLMFLVGIAALVFIIMAGIKANEGQSYRYPVSIRLIK